MFSKLHVSQLGNRMKIQMNILAGVTEIEVRLFSKRNHSVSRLSDVSTRNPNGEKLNHKKKDNEESGEVYFPVIDIALESGMEAVSVFQGEP
jgi:hypothetical protein